MRSRFSRFRLSPAFPISLLALFVALGGIAAAAATIGTKDLKKNAVTSKKIKNHTIKKKDLKFKINNGVQGPAGPAGPAGAAGAAGPAGPAGPGQAVAADLLNAQQTVNGGVWSVEFGEKSPGIGCEDPVISNDGASDGVVFVTNLSGGSGLAFWTDVQPVDSGDSTSVDDVVPLGFHEGLKYEIDMISPNGVKEVTFIAFTNPDNNHCVVVGSDIHIP